MKWRKIYFSFFKESHGGVSQSVSVKPGRNINSIPSGRSRSSQLSEHKGTNWSGFQLIFLYATEFIGKDGVKIYAEYQEPQYVVIR